MLPLGSSIHALAVTAAAGVRPVDGEHVRDTLARALGVAGDLYWRIPSEAPQHGAIVICPHARAAYKEWPEERWQSVIDDVLRTSHRPLAICGMPGRTFLGRVMPAQGVCELATMLGGASLVVAVDSGPLHLADALGVPVIGLYAATSSTTYGPYRNRERCIDRHRQAHARMVQPYDSARHVTHGDPMRLISADEVIARIHAHA